MKCTYKPTCKRLERGLFLLLAMFTVGFATQAQEKSLTQTILAEDALFWKAYNSCNIDQMVGFFTDDMEFYHDRSGLTNSKSVLKNTLKTGLCSDPASKLRREAVEGSVKVYPLNNYGAIITGEHIFYRNKQGQNEYAEESAKFTHVWRFKDNQWKMTRVLSYDHVAVPYENTKKEIQLTEAELSAFAGTYEGNQTGTVEISVTIPNLSLKAEQFGFTMYPQTSDSFFIKERPITFSFKKDAAGKVIQMVVKENGAVAEELTKVK